MRQASSVIIITKNNQIALQQRDNIPNIANPGKTTLFAGSCEKNENPAQGMIRELKEELSIDVKPKEITLFDKIFVDEKEYPEANYTSSFYANVFILKNVDPHDLDLKEGKKVVYIPLDQDLDKINLSRFTKQTLGNFLDKYKHELK